MKIATYHKMLGDEVTYIKGNISDKIIHIATEDILSYLIDLNIPLSKSRILINEYIKKGSSDLIESIIAPINDPDLQGTILKKLQLYRTAKNQKRLNEIFFWDRIYVTTLFTFYWTTTIKCIHDAKQYVLDENDLFVGGVMASLIPNEMENETGVKPISGLLDSPGQFDQNDIIIDDLPPDYLMLDQIDYEYPAKDSYITFMTKGCTRTCSFCSVPKIEPSYREYVPTQSKIDYISRSFGRKKNLLLMDNNVLASPSFPKIIDEILSMGFTKDALYTPENNFEIYMELLKKGEDDKSYLISIYTILMKFKTEFNKKRYKGSRTDYDKFLNILIENRLNDRLTISKNGLMNAYDDLSPIIQKYRKKSKRKIYVDFNQGTDARYVTDEIMRKLSKLPIRPLRIAFDYIGMKDAYVKAVELAAKYKINELSNYLLYNFKDSPNELWERMKINIDLSNKLDIEIFSFPMKYIPLYGEESKSRTYIGSKWNKKFIRSIQIILNVTKGIVASGDEFFNRAFGKTENEFMSIIHMPEAYIMYRDIYEKSGLIEVWKQQFSDLTQDELAHVLPIIYKSEFFDLKLNDFNDKLSTFLSHYQPIDTQTDIYKSKDSYSKVRQKYNKLIKDDVFLDMTLTYDFDNSSLEKLGKSLYSTHLN